MLNSLILDATLNIQHTISLLNSRKILNKKSSDQSLSRGKDKYQKN